MKQYTKVIFGIAWSFGSLISIPSCHGYLPNVPLVTTRQQQPSFISRSPSLGGGGQNVMMVPMFQPPEPYGIKARYLFASLHHYVKQSNEDDRDIHHDIHHDIIENNQNNENKKGMKKNPNRRTFLSKHVCNLAAMVGFTTSMTSLSVNAADVSEDSTTSNKTPSSVVVIGANGKTGSECVKALSNRSIPIIATSRSGIYNDPAASSFTNFQTMVCDVTQPSTIDAVLSSSPISAVIFAASASKQGGTPAQVDNEGLIAVAKACVAAQIPRLVIVSSGAVTKPSSPVFLFLNLFGKIMEEKIKGENAVRALYASSASASSAAAAAALSYTIIRPGGLTEEEALGVSALELNQGDTKSGRIARADVAQLCVESILNPTNTENVTFECYNKDTGAPLASVGMSNIMKAKTNAKGDDKVFISGKERLGSTWEELFTGLEKDEPV